MLLVVHLETKKAAKIGCCVRLVSRLIRSSRIISGTIDKKYSGEPPVLRQRAEKKSSQDWLIAFGKTKTNISQDSCLWLRSVGRLIAFGYSRRMTPMTRAMPVISDLGTSKGG